MRHTGCTDVRSPPWRFSPRTPTPVQLPEKAAPLTSSTPRTSATTGVRLLHTSDWHIGRRFHQVDLLDQQVAFGEWLVDVVRSESIDAVLVAGDLYDRATPAGEAVEALDHIFLELLGTGATVIAISGNHDSAERVNFGSRAMRGAGLHLRAERRSVLEIGAPIEVTGRSGATVEVLPVPYLDPHRLIETGGVERTHDAVLRAVVRAQIENLRNPATAIAMAHTFVTGGTTSSSERELAVGGSSATAIDLFDGLGYVALGHLHRPQEFHGGRVAYSGSPIPYSFSEEHAKSVRIVECGATIATRALPVEVGRPVRTIRGTLEHLLRSPEFADAADAWVRAELTDTSLQLGAIEQLRKRFPNILELEQAGLRRQSPAELQPTAERVTRTPVDIVDDYLAETFPDLDPDDTAFVHAAVTAALKDAE